MQDLDSQVNRPHGWAFRDITNGEIKYMKLWQVSVGVVRPVLQSDLTPASLSPWPGVLALVAPRTCTPTTTR